MQKQSTNSKGQGKASRWSANAGTRIANRKWLNYSSQIARRILAAIEDNPSMTQAVLAEKIGVSRQYINRIIKGHENLSLETIAKLSSALGVEFITFPSYKYSLNTKLLLLPETVEAGIKMCDRQFYGDDKFEVLKNYDSQYAMAS